MPATRPRASFEPIVPDFDLKALVESTPNFSYVDRISCDMIDQQGLAAFEKLILLHVVVGGKPLVIDGFEDRIDPWTFTPKWLRDNCGDKHETARNLTSKESLPLTMGHYLKNMGMMTNQFFSKPDAYREQKRQRVYLKDIDCPDVWRDKLRDHIPSMLFYLNESTADNGPGAVEDPNTAGRTLSKGIARAGDLMSSLPTDMRAENLMCYIGHEGTYTPAHREMCASLGHNIMVEASNTVSADDGIPEKPGSSIWFMTESKDRQTVSEYWLSVLGHDIEVENHFAQIVAWKKAKFSVYVVEQRPGDFILIPPLAPHQVWNRGTRTMKVAWNRTTVETLEMALNEALPRSRIVCRDEQYKNKAIIYYTLQKYSSLLALAQKDTATLSADAAQKLVSSPKIKQLIKDFKRLFNLYRQILLSEMFNPEDTPKGIEYIPFDSNVTCAYCRGNIFNRFLTCPNCKDVLGHTVGSEEGDPYDVCMDCYAMGRSCACISHLKWVEQFHWKELAAKYEGWRKLLMWAGQSSTKMPLPLSEEKQLYGMKTLAEVCKEQLKRRPFKDVRKPSEEDAESQEAEEEEIVVDDNGMVKKVQKKRSKAWLKNNSACHVCCHRHPNWKMAQCTTCERMWCYGSLFRGWDKMPIDIMEDENWKCPHCLGICFAGACKREGKMQPYEPKGTLLGHDTRKVADARSVEALVDFSVSNLNWLKEDDPANRAESRRLQKANEAARRAKESGLEVDVDAAVEFDYDSDRTPPVSAGNAAIDPALVGQAGVQDGVDPDAAFAMRLQEANETMQDSNQHANGGAPQGYTAVTHAGYVPVANMYPQPDEAGGYSYPGYLDPALNGNDVYPEPQSTKRLRTEDDDEGGELDDQGISMTKAPKYKRVRLTAAGFQSSDLAGTESPGAKANKSEAQRQFEKEKERKALEKAKAQGRFIIMQAALKGKRRVVRLAIRPHRLRESMAQQAARAALEISEEADADHEIEDAPAQQLEAELEDEADTVLLKSDIAPKKPKPTAKQTYQQKVKDGFVVSGSNRKAMVPVEKDENYGYRLKAKDKAGNDGSEKRSKRRSAANVEYEEVDVGSDNDDEGQLFVPASSTTKSRRGTSSYSLNRVSNGTATPASAGKRPTTRPSLNTPITLADDEDEEMQEVINGAIDGDFMNVDEATMSSKTQEAVSFTAVNRPALNGTVAKPPRARAVGRPSNPGILRRQAMEADNRLAKMQAFELVAGDADKA